jgi:hypothetical protein
MTNKRISLWHCLWGLPFLAIGIGFFAYFLIHGLTHVTDSLTQVVVPGKAELSLQHEQTYTVFLEEQSVVNGKIYSTTQSINGLECRVKSLQKNTDIAAKTSSTNTSYELNGRSGHSVLEFFIREDGRYEFSCDYGENSTGPEAVVAVGSRVGATIFSTIAGALGSFFGGVGTCTMVVFVVLIKRDREKKRMMAASIQQCGWNESTKGSHSHDAGFE